MVDITATDRLLALFIAAVSTGMYLCTFFYCIRWLVYADEGWKIRKGIDKIMLSGTLAIFVMSSIHTSLAVSTSFAAIQDLEKGVPTNHAAPLPWTSVVMCTVTNAVVLIADGFLIYRCWLVCLKSFPKIIFPCFFWVGGLVCTLLQIYWQVVQSAVILSVWTPVNMTIGPGTILTPFWGSTIVVNIYSTSVIVYTLWKTARVQFTHSASECMVELRFIMRVLIESGALYLVITIPHFIVWWTQSSLAILILGWTNLPVVGSAFNLILIRTSWHRAKEDSLEESVISAMSAMHFSLPNSHSNTFRAKADIFSTSSSVGI